MVTTGPAVVLFVAGILLIAGSGYALVHYEGVNPAGQIVGTGGGSAFTVAWASAAHQHFQSQDVAEPSSIPVTFAIDHGEMEKVELVVECTDTNPAAGQAPVTIHVALKGPDGLTGTKDGACGGKVTLDIPVNALPATSTQTGATAAAAEASALAANDQAHPEVAKKGVGSWTGSVTFTPPAPVSLPVTPPVGGYDAKVTGSGFHFAPHATAVVR
ncbi:MAG: hypothetical protein ACYDCK_03885 [Thermoplasmatota archaeon]